MTKMSSISYARLSNGEYITPFQIQGMMEKRAGSRDIVLATYGKLECPECKEELIFVQESERARTYLRHKVDSACIGGGEGTLHKVAKSLIIKHKDRLKFCFQCQCQRHFPINFEGTFQEETPCSLGGNAYRFDIGIATAGVVDQAIEVCHTHPSTQQKIDDMDKHLKRWCEVDAMSVISVAEGKSSTDLICVKKCMIKECSSCERNRALMTYRASMWHTCSDDASPFQQLTNEVMRFINERATALKINYTDSRLYMEHLIAGDLILQAGKHRGTPIGFVMRVDPGYIFYLAGYRNQQGLEHFTGEERRKAIDLLAGKCRECGHNVEEDWKTLCKKCWRKGNK